MSRINKRWIAVVILFALALTVGVLSPRISLAQDDNKTIITKMVDAYNAAIKSGDPKDLLAFYSPDYVDANTGKPGTDNVTASLTTFAKAFPDGQLTIVDIVAEGDKVAVHTTFTGTNSGPFATLPATGKPVKFEGVDFYTFKDGKIVSDYSYGQTFELMQQLGFQFTPPAAATPAG